MTLSLTSSTFKLRAIMWFGPRNPNLKSDFKYLENWRNYWLFFERRRPRKAKKPAESADARWVSWDLLWWQDWDNLQCVQRHISWLISNRLWWILDCIWAYKLTDKMPLYLALNSSLGRLCRAIHEGNSSIPLSCNIGLLFYDTSFGA